MTAIEQADVSNPLDQLGGRPGRETVERRIARLAFAHPRADLDEFMIGEGTVEFTDHTVGQPGVAEHHDRMQRVRETPQMLFLFFREWHPAQYSRN